MRHESRLSDSLCGGLGCHVYQYHGLGTGARRPEDRRRNSRTQGVRVLLLPERPDTSPPASVFALFGSLIVAVMALLYAGMLVKQVISADQGTKKMQEIAAAVREGANAYLARQLKVVGVLIIVLVFVLFFIEVPWPAANYAKRIRPRPRGAFFVGAIFSGLVGFVGMSLAVQRQPPRRRGGPGRLRQGAAARLPHRHDHRHADRRPRPAGRHGHLHDLRRARL